MSCRKEILSQDLEWMSLDRQELLSSILCHGLFVVNWGEISCDFSLLLGYENCSGPMDQHYRHGATILRHPGLEFTDFPLFEMNWI